MVIQEQKNADHAVERRESEKGGAALENEADLGHEVRGLRQLVVGGRVARLGSRTNHARGRVQPVACPINKARFLDGPSFKSQLAVDLLAQFLCRTFFVFELSDE